MHPHWIIQLNHISEKRTLPRLCVKPGNYFSHHANDVRQRSRRQCSRLEAKMLSTVFRRTMDSTLHPFPVLVIISAEVHDIICFSPTPRLPIRLQFHSSGISDISCNAVSRRFLAGNPHHQSNRWGVLTEIIENLSMFHFMLKFWKRQPQVRDRAAKWTWGSLTISRDPSPC